MSFLSSTVPAAPSDGLDLLGSEADCNGGESVESCWACVSGCLMNIAAVIVAVVVVVAG